MKIRILASIAASVLTAAGFGGIYAHASSPHPAAESAAGNAAGGSYSRTTMGTVGSTSKVAGSTRVINVSRYRDAAFVSPTGHIACELTYAPDTEEEPGASFVSCTFPDGPVLRTVPTQKAACAGDFADFHGVSAGTTDDPASWDCSDNLDADPRWQHGNSAVRWAAVYGMPTVTWYARGNDWGRSAELPYGTTLVAGTMACSMHTTGVVCESLKTHKGFALNSHRVTPVGVRAIARG